MSRTLSINRGSWLSLKLSVRCGWRAKARQMRLMAVWFSPATLAMERVDQWVASEGLLSRVRVMTASTCASLILRGCPGRGSRSEEHTSELHHGYISYAVFCLQKKRHDSRGFVRLMFVERNRRGCHLVAP